jgi:hypothetical protein
MSGAPSRFSRNRPSSRSARKIRSSSPKFSLHLIVVCTDPESALKESSETEKALLTTKEAKEQTLIGVDRMKQQYTSAAIETQKFDNASVIRHLTQYIAALEPTCSHSSLKEKISSASDKASLDKALMEFIKKRTDYQKLVIQKNYLSGTASGSLLKV